MKRWWLSWVFCVFVLAIVSGVSATNVSIQYGWNGTDYIPIKLNSEGAVLTDIDMLNLTAGNLYAVGNVTAIYFKGDGSLLTGVEGGTNVSINYGNNGSDTIPYGLTGDGKLKMQITNSVADDIGCTDCIGVTEIEDVYLLNNGDTAIGNYTFDSGTLFVDSSNDRVGIGTTSPSEELEVNGTVKATSFVGDGSAITGIESIPSGFIGMFNSSCPSGWTYLSAMAGKFARGSTTYGGTGGSDTHTHTDTLAAPAHTHTVTTNVAVSAHSHTLAAPAHTHTGPNHTHTGPSHTHAAGTLAGPSHTHTGPSHTHTGTTGGPSATVDVQPSLGEYHIYPGGATHTHSFTSAADGTGATGASGTGAVTGSTAAEGTGATGASGTGATGAASATALTGSISSHTVTNNQVTSDGASATALTGGVDSGDNVPAYVNVVFCLKN